ncbi:MAG: hypothetical protein DDT40_01786 [candidate division WS2 bacterium]|nr:hypothetical protein [Candidatus Psychracetigena formicireducens]
MFALKLLGTHAIMSLVQFLFMPAFFGLWQDNVIYQWAVGILYIAIFWLVVYADASSRGSEDFKKGDFTRRKGAVSGATASIPALLLYISALIYGYPSETVNWFITILRVWLVPYTMLFTSFEHMILWTIPAIILVFPVVTGLSYMDGERRRKGIIAIIDRAKSLKIEKSKINSKRKI